MKKYFWCFVAVSLSFLYILITVESTVKYKKETLQTIHRETESERMNKIIDTYLDNQDKERRRKKEEEKAQRAAEWEAIKDEVHHTRGY